MTGEEAFLFCISHSNNTGATVTTTRLEITGSGLAITARRFIQYFFNENNATVCDRVAICTNITKNGSNIVPQSRFSCASLILSDALI